MIPESGEQVASVIAAYQAVGIAAEAVAFARTVVAAADPVGPARARSLLWVCSRLAAWGAAAGLELRAEVLLHPSVIERFVAVGMAGARASARRTARTNLRFVARRVVPGLVHPPAPAPLGRNRAKAPYSPAQVAGFFALAAAQPTEARRQRLVGLLCLGLGAGLERGELRGVAGHHVVPRGTGVVVEVVGPRARAVPVLVRYQEPLLGAAAFAGEDFVCGGRSPTRRNVTSTLLDSVAGGPELGRLDAGRLRSTWLAEHLGRLGLDALLQAAGVVCSQRLGDLVRHLPPLDEDRLIEVLGGRR